MGFEWYRDCLHLFLLNWDIPLGKVLAFAQSYMFNNLKKESKNKDI